MGMSCQDVGKKSHASVELHEFKDLGMSDRVKIYSSRILFHTVTILMEIQTNSYLIIYPFNPVLIWQQSSRILIKELH